MLNVDGEIIYRTVTLNTFDIYMHKIRYVFSKIFNYIFSFNKNTVLIGMFDGAS